MKRDASTLDPHRASLARYVLVVSLVLLLALPAYHPYYFGDELFSFTAAADQRGWGATYAVLNSYKPRLVYNAIWASIAVSGAPRWAAMMVVVFALAAAACLLQRIATRNFGATPRLGWAVAAVVLTSRFGIVAFHDYVSGSIELVSLSIFLWLVAAVLDRMQEAPPSPRWQGWAIVAASLLLVCVHERYLAALCALAAVLAVDALRKAPCDWAALRTSAAMIALPLGGFAIATRLLSVLPIETGTAGRAVSLGPDTLLACARYLGNVFLGTNFGHAWLVGGLQWSDASWRPLLGSMALVLGLAWLAPLVVPRWRNHEHLAGAALLLLSILALAAVASLPGTDRQEGRWMIPVLACAALLACAISRGVASWLLVGALMACNMTYQLSGSWQSIYNVTASHSANEIASALDTLVPGDQGIVLNVAVDDYDWPLGGIAFAGSDATSGRVFCAINMDGRACVDPPARRNLANPEKYDFGLFFVGNRDGRQVYRIVPRSGLRVLLDPQSADMRGMVAIGDADTWRKDWKWDSVPAFAPGGVVLRPGMTGTRNLASTTLAGRVLVYQAHALRGGEPVPMRLQVNWGDASGQFLDTQIRVVQVDAESRRYSTLLSPPANAAFGQVYATLHDGAAGEVLLESISVLAQ